MRGRVCAAARSCAVLGAIAAVACAAPAQTWRFDGGPEGGRVQELKSTAAETLAVTAAGLFRSLDSGATWSLIGDGQGLEPQTVTRSGSTLLVGTAAGPVLRSHDDGVTWESLAPPPGMALVSELQCSAGIVFAIASTDTAPSAQASLFMSSDEGNTWEPVSIVDAPSWLLVQGPVVLAGGSAGIHRSPDSGATWTLIQPVDVLPDFSVFGRPIWLGNVLYLRSTGLFSFDQVWRSADGGLTMQPVATGVPVSERILGWAGHDGAVVALIAGSGGAQLWRGSDGAAWTVVNPSAVVSAISDGKLELASAPGAILMGTPGFAISGVLRSVDDGATFAQSNSGLVGAGASAIAAAGDGLLAIGAQKRDLWQRSAAGTWSPKAPGANGEQVLAVGGLSASTVFAGTNGDGIFRSTDGGGTWAPANAGVPTYNGTAGLQFREISAFATAGGIVFAGTGFGTEFAGTGTQHGAFITTGGGMLRSTNGGASWMRINSGIPVQGFNRDGEPIYPPVIAMEEIGGAVVAATMSGFFRTTNGGASWHAAGTGVPTAYDVTALEAHDGRLFAATRADGVLVSEDSGATFSPVAAAGLPDRPVLSLASAGATLHAALGERFGAPPLTDADRGVYSTTDLGATWTPAGDAPRAATSVAMAGGTLFAAAGPGVWRADPTLPCAADLTGDGAADVFDLLVYLDLWFALDAAADRTGDAVVDVFDLLGYLDDWFAGC